MTEPPETVVTPSAALIVPWRRTESRGRAWDWLRAYYENALPDFEIIEGDDPSRFPFSKPAAANRAVEQTSADVLVILDADVYLAQRHLLDAVRLVGTGQATWMTPVDRVYRLDQARTEKLLSFDPRSSVTPWPEERGSGGKPMRPWKHAAMVVVGFASEIPANLSNRSVRDRPHLC